LSTAEANKLEELLKSRSRKGIPDSMRGAAWPFLAQIDDWKIPEAYGGDVQFWMSCLLEQPLPVEVLKCIDKDVRRTMTQHQMFN